MNLWMGSQRDRSLQHQFAIGPLDSRNRFGRTGQLYYCIRCRWSFAVTGRHIAALGDDRTLLSGPEARARLESFDHGPCPRLHALASAIFARAADARPAASQDRGWPGRDTERLGIRIAARFSPREYSSIRSIMAHLASFRWPVFGWRVRRHHPVA